MPPVCCFIFQAEVLSAAIRLFGNPFFRSQFSESRSHTVHCRKAILVFPETAINQAKMPLTLRSIEFAIIQAHQSLFCEIRRNLCGISQLRDVNPNIEAGFRHQHGYPRAIIKQIIGIFPPAIILFDILCNETVILYCRQNRQLRQGAGSTLEINRCTVIYIHDDIISIDPPHAETAQSHSLGAGTYGYCALPHAGQRGDTDHLIFRENRVLKCLVAHAHQIVFYDEGCQLLQFFACIALPVPAMRWRVAPSAIGAVWGVNQAFAKKEATPPIAYSETSHYMGQDSIVFLCCPAFLLSPHGKAHTWIGS